MHIMHTNSTGLPILPYNLNRGVHTLHVFKREEIYPLHFIPIVLQNEIEIEVATHTNIIIMAVMLLIVS